MAVEGRDGQGSASAGALALVAQLPRWSIGLVAASLIAWAFLAWIVVDMSHPFAQLTMPASPDWRVSNLLAILAMWALMMAAMMLPSAMPMVLCFVVMSRHGGETARGHSFVGAYLAVWSAFSVAATAAQWLLQRLDWIDPMLVSTSSALSAALLLIAGVYQFSPLKRTCLSRCQTPMGFLLGEWRPGVRGAFVMGLRHGLFCLGCCWALMALLFVGGVMNLAWISAVSIAVALEKLLPRGERIAAGLGIALIAVAGVKLLAIGGGL